MYGNGMMDGMPMMGGFGWIIMLLFWALAIAGLFFTVHWFLSRGKPDQTEKPSQTPLDILKSRYARGEINAEEYTRIKSELE